jgi:hypothetical protein
VPDPRSLLRLAALTGFLLLVAVGLWLLDASWPVIIPVMAAAWALAAVVEWAAWRQQRYGSVVARPEPTSRHEPAVVPAGPEPAPVEAPEPLRAPSAEEEAALSPPKAEPVGEPTLRPLREEAPAEPEPKARTRPRVTRPRAAPRAKPALRPVPQPPPPRPPRPEEPPAAAVPVPQSGVVDLRRRATAQARQWNLWDLERLAREELQQDPDRFQELSYLFVHLRQFASADGSLPTEFDPLVRESLGDLLEHGR